MSYLAIYFVLVGVLYAGSMREPPEEHPPCGPLLAAFVLPILFALSGLAFCVLAPIVWVGKWFGRMK
mgnify:CR=1 FL=1